MLWCFYVQTKEGTIQKDVYAECRGEAFYKVSELTGQRDTCLIHLFRIVKGNESVEY
jgi:hypothetical protein